MGSLFLALALTVLGIANCYQRCPTDFSWKPFNGNIPDNAFVGGFDREGNPTFIVKTVVLDDLWTTPAQLYLGNDYIDFAWYRNTNIMRIDLFVEILVTDNKSSLMWVNMKKDDLSKAGLKKIAERCCIVEGGIGVRDGHVYLAYIGKVMPDGVTSYIGRVYKDTWEGLHIMYGTNSTKVYDDIQVLTYGCQDDAEIRMFDESKLA